MTEPQKTIEPVPSLASAVMEQLTGVSLLPGPPLLSSRQPGGPAGQSGQLRKILKNNVPKPAWRISHIDEGEGVMRRSPDQREEKIIPKNKTTQTNKHLLHRFEGERLHFTSPCCAAGGTERVHSVERERTDTYIYKNPRAQTVDGG